MATTVERRAAYADPVRDIRDALSWYDAGNADGRAAMLADAAAYLRAAGHADLAAGLEAALGAKAGDEPRSVPASARPIKARIAQRGPGMPAVFDEEGD